MPKFKNKLTEWRNKLDFNGMDIPLENISYPLVYMSNPNLYPPDTYPHTLEYMTVDESIVTNYYSDDTNNNLTFSDEWTSQKYIDSYIYENYKEVLSIPDSDTVYFILRSKIKSISVSNAVLSIVLFSDNTLNITYPNSYFALYHYNYIFYSLEELNLNFDDGHWVHIYNGTSLKTMINLSPRDAKFFVHSGTYNEGSINIGGTEVVVYCEEGVDMNCAFQCTSVLNGISYARIYGHANFSWSGENGFCPVFGGGSVYLSCKDINIQSTGGNNPVVFAQASTFPTYISVKGRKVSFYNTSYTFLDFDSTDKRFIVDIDFAKITLLGTSLEYGFFQDENEACIIWRNAFVYNEGNVPNIIDLNSSFFQNNHILINLKTYNPLANTINIGSDIENNIFDVYIYSCWFQCDSTVFANDFGYTQNITFFGKSYSKTALESTPILNFTNLSNITINPTLNLLS